MKKVIYQIWEASKGRISKCITFSNTKAHIKLGQPSHTTRWRYQPGYRSMFFKVFSVKCSAHTIIYEKWSAVVTAEAKQFHINTFLSELLHPISPNPIDSH